MQLKKKEMNDKNDTGQHTIIRKIDERSTNQATRLD